MLKVNNVADSLCIPEIKNDRNSNSTATTQSQCSSPTQLPSERYHVTGKNWNRMEVFRSWRNLGEISQKVVEKAITWIQITGYTKKFNFDTITLTIALFYTTLHNLPLTKKNLQSTICACMLLSSKMTTHNHLTLNEVLSLIENRQTASNIREQQKKILEVLDYNLHYQFGVDLVEVGAEEDLYKLQFLAELLLIKQPGVLADEYIIQGITQLSQTKTNRNTPNAATHNKLRQKIQKILRKNNCDHLVNKYQAKFNVQQFVVEMEPIYDYV